MAQFKYHNPHRSSAMTFVFSEEVEMPNSSV